MIVRPLATVAIAAALVGCGGSGGSTGAASRSPGRPVRAAAAGVSCPPAGRSSIPGGQLRMPARAVPGRMPLLVVVVPGKQGDPGDHLGIGRAATRAGFGVLYPTSDRGDSWTLDDRAGTADVTDVTALLDRVAPAAGGCFDPDRISITGVSNGAGFATRMACELPARFAAVAPVAAGYRALDPCPPTSASFLAIHGTADRVVPYLGAPPAFKGNVPRFTARWARRAGCGPRPRRTRPRRLVTRLAYRGCDGGRRVELLRLTGTDHGWPGSGPPLPRRNPSGLHATIQVLRFVRGARRHAV